MITLDRITHTEACAFHRGDRCDCDREQLHTLLVELPRVIAAATTPHAARTFGHQCTACIGERRLRELGRQFRGEAS